MIDKADSMESWYVKIRGHVYGPFDHAKLRSMVARGQVTRIHQVSLDNQLWEAATTIPGLFEPPPASEKQTATLELDYPLGPPSGSPAATTGWYYGNSGQPVGPVGQSEIEMMVRQGRLTIQDLVWRDGMGDWGRVDSIPEFRALLPISPAATAGHFSPGTDHAQKCDQEAPTSGRLDPELVRAAVATRPWIVFLVITWFTLGGLMIFGSTYGVFLGVREGNSTKVALQLMSLVCALTVIVGASFGNRYSGQLVAVQYERSAEALARAVRSLGVLWVYLGVCTIIWLVAILIIVILAIAEMPADWAAWMTDASWT